MSKPLMSKPLISIAMIVKNEEECLPRALANWKVLGDELIIVDTGSTDNTIEIAQAHDATVLHYDWRYPGNKGEARNVGLDAAQGEWAVVLDADEIIKDPARLRLMLHKTAKEVTGCNVLFENYDNGNLTLRWYQVRAFRRDLYHYIHREHELPHWKAKSGQPSEFILDGIVFEHRAPTGREPGKMEPMMDRLTLDVEEQPDSPGPLFFLARQYLLNGQYQESIDWNERFLALQDIDPCEAYGHMASAYHALGNTQEALRWLYRATAEQAHRRIWWVRIAELHMTQGRWQLALSHLRLASELWPEFEWQWEPSTNGSQLHYLIDKCQRALQSMHHSH